MLSSLHCRMKVMIADERGATAVEYGLMVALIAAAIISGVTLLGSNADKLFSDVAALLKL